MNVFMPYVAFELNEVLNLLCMRNGKLIGRTVCNTGMPVRLTEMKYNAMVTRLIIPLLAYYSLKPSVVVDVVF